LYAQNFRLSETHSLDRREPSTSTKI